MRFPTLAEKGLRKTTEYRDPGTMFPFIRYRRVRALCMMLLLFVVGFHAYISKLCLLLCGMRLSSALQGNQAREYVDEFLPQSFFTDHAQAFCSPWRREDIEFPPDRAEHTPLRAKWRGVRQTTSPFDSTVQIMNRRDNYEVCDGLKVRIEVRNWRGQTKRYGGDYIRATISSRDPPASANADFVMDFGNGTYVAYFTLRWPATDVEVGVALVHPREAVDVLRGIQESVPNRFVYTGRYNRKGNRTSGENAPCHVTKPDVGWCNFSDPRVYAPWFCERPSRYNLTCAHLTWHRGDNVRANEEASNIVTSSQAWLFYLQKKKLTSLDDPFNVSHHVPKPGLPSSGLHAHNVLPYCTMDSMPRTLQTAGYFYNEIWYPNDCRVRSFKATEALTCLRNKSLHFYGDSTVRQLYEFFVDRCWMTFHEERIRTPKFWKVGPLRARDGVNNITLSYQHHGLPIRNNWTWVKDIRYIANELDDLRGGSDVVVVISLWAHFTATTFEFFERRVRDIEAAVQRLWRRSPGTTVIVKGANTRSHHGLSYALYASDWYAMNLEGILRKVFGDEKRLGYIDVWDMTTAHHKNDAIHPSNEVVANVVNRLLTYVCI